MLGNEYTMSREQDPSGYSTQGGSVILKVSDGKQLAERSGMSPRGEAQQVALRPHHIF